MTGDCDDPAFHPRYATMVKEWDGTSDQANHVNDPGPNAGFDGKGNREAYYLAAESAINEARHSVLEGTAPAGTRLRLTKDFKTETYQGASSVDDHLETVYDVGASGAFRWHVNPSTRPIVAKETGNAERRAAERAAAGQHRRSGGDGRRPDRRRRRSQRRREQQRTGELQRSPADDPHRRRQRGRRRSAIQWATIASDWDMKLYRDTNGDGKSQDAEERSSAPRSRARRTSRRSAPEPDRQSTCCASTTSRRPSPTR